MPTKFEIFDQLMANSSQEQQTLPQSMPDSNSRPLSKFEQFDRAMAESARNRQNQSPQNNADELTPKEREFVNRFKEVRANPIGSAYEAYNSMDDNEKEGFFNSLMKLAVKAPIAATASVGDLLTTVPYNAYVAASNAITGNEKPYSKSLEQVAEEGVDTLTGGRTKGGGNIYEGVKMASSLAIPGTAATKIAKKAIDAGREIPAVAKVLNFVGSDNPKVIASAVPTGIAMNEAQKRDVGAAGQFGIGAATSSASQALLGLNKQNLVKTGLALGGIGGKGLKTDIIDAGKRIGVDIPITGATDSIGIKYLSGIASKAPGIGDKLLKQTENASNQYRKSTEDLLDKIGKPKEEVQYEITKAYDAMRIAADKAKNDLIDPSKILDQISSIEKGLKAIVTSDVTRNLKSVINEIKGNLYQSTKGIENLPTDLQQSIKKQSIKKVPLETMISSKEQLNEIMRDKNLFGKQYPGRESQLKQIAQAIDDSLEEYGKTNPDFLTKFRKANKLYSDTMKRERVDDLLSGKLYNAQGEVSYAPLSKILKDRKNQNFLKNNLGLQNYKKLADFAKVAEGIAKSQKNVLNPSGTAPFGIVAAGLGAIGTLAAGGNVAPLIGSGIGIGGASFLLLNKRFLDAATKLAKQPTVPRAEKFWKAFEDRTGITYQEYAQSIKNEQEKKENKGLVVDVYPSSSHK